MRRGAQHALAGRLPRAPTPRGSQDRTDLLAKILAAGTLAARARAHLLETSLPGVFAIGDVRAGSLKRVASAVGEGSIAIAAVHQVLHE